jgi:hypothetical protein
MERKRSKEYEAAKNKVALLKGFYIHSIVFVGVNLFLMIMRSNFWEGGTIEFRNWMTYNTVWFWGLGLLIHGAYTFYVVRMNGVVFRNWEERKIQEIMDKEDENIPKKRNWE